jgi:putative PIN family toxin of toxin-antitoxin system
LCVSNEILLEYQEILEKKTSPSVAENITNFITISPFTEAVEIHYRFNLISDDVADNKFVDCAIASNAACIISNDRHFQVLKSIEFPKVLIFTVEEFEQQNRSNLDV